MTTSNQFSLPPEIKMSFYVGHKVKPAPVKRKTISTLKLSLRSLETLFIIKKRVRRTRVETHLVIISKEKGKYNLL